MTEVELSKVKQFIANCDEVIDCNFLISEAKMQKLLASLADTKPVYDLISDCLEQFNREREMVKAFVEDGTGKSKCVMPKEEYKIIGLVFCVLADITRGEINFTDFVKRYFSNVEGVHCYKQFGKQFVLPFRNLIAEAFALPPKEDVKIKRVKENAELEDKFSGVSPDFRIDDEEFDKRLEKSNVYDMLGQKIVVVNGEIQDPPVDGVGGVCYRCGEIAKQMIDELNINEKGDKDRVAEMKTVLHALIMACEDQNFDIICGLFIAIKYAAKPFKNLRFLVKELDEEITAFQEKLLGFTSKK